jgi:DtxR family Mn-dependent transcriptional regulator
MVAVKDNSSMFLQYVAKVGLGINNEIAVLSKQEYDSIMVIEVNGVISSVSQKFAENILVVCNNCIVGQSCLKAKCEIK